MSQKTAILDMLKRGTVTPLDALNKIGCMRPAARVFELRQDGYDIVTNRASNGGKEFASYVLQQCPC